MAGQSNTTKLSPLESLPIELKNLIFDRLLDIPSLLAAVLTGPELYHAFKADESRVSRSVLCMQIHETSMSDATGAWVARSHFNKYWTVQRTQKFFHETEDRNESFLKNVNLAKALQMSQLHSAVQHLALGLVQHGVRSANMSMGLRERWQSFNLQKLSRVERALYRFELYCIFFGDPSFRVVEKGVGQREAFWNYFAPWEIEQIASVSEYVQVAILPFVEHLAMTVPKWTNLLHYSSDCNPPLEDFVLARMWPGLQYVRSFVDQDLTRQHNRPILEDPYPYVNNFIQESLDCAIEDSQGWTLSDLESDPRAADMRSIIKPARYDDGDPGPETMWRWAYQNGVSDYEEQSRFVRCPSSKSLRSFAYVFIDMERAQKWFFLETAKTQEDFLDFSDWTSARYQDLSRRIDKKEIDWSVAGVHVNVI